jgi:hypothetical protein
VTDLRNGGLGHGGVVLSQEKGERECSKAGSSGTQQRSDGRLGTSDSAILVGLC